MDPNDTTRPACTMPERDARDHPNLCCCLILDAAGGLVEPCPLPAAGCCRSGAGGEDGPLRAG